MVPHNTNSGTLISNCDGSRKPSDLSKKAHASDQTNRPDTTALASLTVNSESSPWLSSPSCEHLDWAPNLRRFTTTSVSCTANLNNTRKQQMHFRTLSDWGPTTRTTTADFPLRICIYRDRPMLFRL